MRAPRSRSTAWCRRRRLQDYLKWVARHVEILNEAIKGLPREKIRYHVCWGSWPGPHTTDIPLKTIVNLILKLKVGAFVIEGPIRVMSTNGRCGRTSSCRRTWC